MRGLSGCRLFGWCRRRSNRAGKRRCFPAANPVCCGLPVAEMIALEKQSYGLAVAEAAGVERRNDDESLFLGQLKEFQRCDEIVELRCAGDRLRLPEIDAQRIGQRRLEERAHAGECGVAQL